MDFPVKIFSVLFAAAVTATAAPSDPGSVALDFLEKVRVRNLNLEPGGDTAISPQTAREKKELIARRLDRMAGDLGSDRLEVAAVKMDENYAGVLVRKLGGFDPARLQVFAVAMVKRGADWTAAPVPASFENAGAGYAILLRQRLRALEDWMLREQVQDLQKLREESLVQLRGKISSRILPATLRSMDSLQVVENFISACEQGDLPMALGLTGGLAENLPADWPTRLKSIERAIKAGPSASQAWRLFTAPEVVRVIVQNEEDPKNAMVSIGCLDPASTSAKLPKQEIELVHLELSKSSEGLWQINPPPRFLQDAEIPFDEADELLDADLLNAFPIQYRSARPAAPQASAELARETLIQGLRSRDLHTLLALAHFPESPEAARKACAQAARVWQEFHDPTKLRHPLPLSFTADESAACVIFQTVTPRDPDRFQAQIFHFEKSADTWHWSPIPSAAAKAKFQAWSTAETTRWSRIWQAELIPDSQTLKDIPATGATTPEQARTLMQSWISATRDADFPRALGLSAVLDAAGSRSAALRNLGYEIQSARRSDAAPEIIGIYPAKAWCAVGLKIGQGSKALYPLYPIVQTPDGPRILVEADLFASENRSRDYLNKTAIGRLEKSLPAATITELKELMAKHQASIATPDDKTPE